VNADSLLKRLKRRYEDFNGRIQGGPKNWHPLFCTAFYTP